MKTKSDLNALIPTIVELIKKNKHAIGYTYWEQNEDGWCKYEESENNIFLYEEDGWYIEIAYDCCGDWEGYQGDYLTPSSSSLVKAWGEVTEIYASHYDDENDVETEFNDDDLDELWISLDQAIKKI